MERAFNNRSGRASGEVSSGSMNSFFTVSVMVLGIMKEFSIPVLVTFQFVKPF